MAAKSTGLPKSSDDAGHRRRFDKLLERAKKESKASVGAAKHAHTEQSKSFVEAARELGCDESEATFDKMLKKIASAPPPKSVQKRKVKSRKK